jgi:hypothetical protein
MEQMSLNQEAAFERLYRWAQSKSNKVINLIFKIIYI